MTDPLSPEQQAKQRFMVLTAIRFSGVALALAGVAIVAGKIDLPAVAGYGLIALGALDSLLMPLVLVKAWRSPPK